jgi:copper resistance protein C
VKQHPVSTGRIVVLLLSLALFALPAALASAHETTVTRSDPADGSTVAVSPAQVTAQFSEELDTVGSTMIVVDAAGQQVSDGSGKVDLDDPDHATMIATLPARLGDGAYTVQWQALLTDGDASDGEFTFIVEAGGASAHAAMATLGPTMTEAPLATPTAPPTVAPAPASIEQPTPQPPSQLPTTGGDTIWLLEVLAGVLAVLGLSEALRRRCR